MAVQNPGMKDSLSNEAVRLSAIYEERFKKTFLEWKKYINGKRTSNITCGQQRIYFNQPTFFTQSLPLRERVRIWRRSL